MKHASWSGANGSPSSWKRFGHRRTHQYGQVERAVAKVLPEHREPVHDSERRVLTALRRLDDSWTVFHNVKWQAPRRGRQGDGETDFALFHPRDGILVIEAKGGDVIVREGRYLRRQPD